MNGYNFQPRRHTGDPNPVNKRMRRVVDGEESAIDFMVGMLKPDAQQHQGAPTDWLTEENEPDVIDDDDDKEPATINPYVDQYWSPETIETKAFARRVKLAARRGVTLVKDAYGDIWALRVGCPSVRIGE